MWDIESLSRTFFYNRTVSVRSNNPTEETTLHVSEETRQEKSEQAVASSVPVAAFLSLYVDEHMI